MFIIFPCFCSVTKWCPSLHDHMDCSTSGLSFIISWSLLRFTSIESVMLTNHLILCHLLLLLPSIFLSIRVFSNELVTNTSCGWSTGASASVSVFPMNIQGWLPLGLSGLISLLSKGLSRVFSCTTVQKHPFFSVQPSSFRCVLFGLQTWQNFPEIFLLLISILILLW